MAVYGTRTIGDTIEGVGTIERSQLKFRRMSNGQGRYAQLPSGGKVYDWDQSAFAVQIVRFERVDIAGNTVAKGDTLRSVVPELADDKAVEQLRRAGVSWAKAREVERALAAEMYAAIVRAVEGGMSEVQAAKVAGVDRMTVRRALGKL